MENLSEPSEELLNLIKILNLSENKLPPFVSYNFEFQEAYLKKTGKPFSEWDEYDLKTIEAIEELIVSQTRERIKIELPNLLNYLDSLAMKYAEDNSHQVDVIRGFILAWNEYYATYEKFYGVMRAVVNAEKKEQKIALWQPIREFHVFSNKYHYELHDDFTITPIMDDVDKALVGIDIRRIRRCRSCKLIFWAYRIDKVTCSKKCGQRHRTSEYRKKQNNRFQSRVIKNEPENFIN